MLVPEILFFIRDNILKKGNPFGISQRKFINWAKGLEIRKKGEVALYTGCEYQLMPYVSASHEWLKRMGPFALETGLLKGARVFQKLGLDLANFFKISKEDEEFYNNLLRNYVSVFKALGIDFCYLYEKEIYAGALLYEFGFFDDLAIHARKVQEIFKENGVKKLIVISPHSYELLKIVYPTIIDFDIEVIHYTQFLLPYLQKRKLGLAKTLKATLHDPCHLARVGIFEEPRRILRRIKNLEIIEVPTSKRMTTCCGAPCEILLPELCEQLRDQRIKELSSVSSTVITLCPFCLRNFNSSRNGLEIKDFIQILHEAISYGEES